MPIPRLKPITIPRHEPHTVGRRYGKLFEHDLLGFCRQETRPDEQRLAYARACWPYIEQHAPTSAQFMRGVARASNLSIEHLTLLSLHEEIYPWDPHCTAFTATRQATRDGQTLVGMNWDWAPQLQPWARLTRLATNDDPTIVSYGFPGLWVGAGVNEDGLALMWTGAARLPIRETPTPGVPTYVLIAEILRRAVVAEATWYLESVPLAGSFIFLLGDADGRIAVVEAAPGAMTVLTEDDAPAFTRANHFECPDMIRAGRQNEIELGESTCYRAQRMAQRVAEAHGELDAAIARDILTDRDGPGPWINQFPGPDGPDSLTLAGMTLDSLLADCTNRSLHTCRGGRRRGAWHSVRADGKRW